MSTPHPLYTFFAGDTWKIESTLLAQGGAPIPLGGVTLEWILINEDQETVLTSSDVMLTVIDQARGTVRITASKDKTATINAGRYVDALRITTSGGERYTMMTGQIDVEVMDWGDV